MICYEADGLGFGVSGAVTRSWNPREFSGIDLSQLCARRSFILLLFDPIGASRQSLRLFRAKDRLIRAFGSFVGLRDHAVKLPKFMRKGDGMIFSLGQDPISG